MITFGCTERAGDNESVSALETGVIKKDYEIYPF